MRSSPGHTPLECQIKLGMNSYFLWIYEILTLDKVNAHARQQIGIFTCPVIRAELVVHTHKHTSTPNSITLIAASTQHEAAFCGGEKEIKPNLHFSARSSSQSRRGEESTHLERTGGTSSDAVLVLISRLYGAGDPDWSVKQTERFRRSE